MIQYLLEESNIINACAWLLVEYPNCINRNETFHFYAFELLLSTSAVHRKT